MGAAERDKEYTLVVSVAEYALRMLRKGGCGRESLKKMVDRVCNEVPKGGNDEKHEGAEMSA